MSVTWAPRARSAVKASCPGVSRNVIGFPRASTVYAPMCWVIPPNSDAATLVFRMASRRLVFPWSTCPITVTTGGRGSRPFSAGSAAGTSRVGASSVTCTTSGARGAKLNAAITFSATSSGIMWLMPAITPDSTSRFTTSPAGTPIRAAKSPT